MKTLFVLFLIFIFVSPIARAHSWQQISIPGAFCGNGESYSVFVDRKIDSKLMVEFQGGGVCWSERTCYGQTALVSLMPLRGEPSANLMLNEEVANPFSDHSKIYFPYCTADVFGANHVGTYAAGISLYHFGYLNVVLALQYLSQNGIVPFAGVTDLVVWGASAGAIASFVHADNIQVLMPSLNRKTLFSDSPGLHFGNGFWQKFSAQTNKDFQENFGKMGLVYALDDGLIAAHMGPVFAKLHDWKIGILQATKDPAMSLLYGGITPKTHRELVLGPSGIVATAKPFGNVSVWISDVSMHTFLLRRFSGDYRSMQGETAWNFVVRVYSERTAFENKKPAY